MRAPAIPVIFVALGLTLAVAGCSGRSAETPAAPTATDTRVLAETMIAGDLATAVGLGPLTPTCDEPGPLSVGTTFACTATLASETPVEPIRVRGTVNPDGHLALTTENLITAAAMPSFERQAAAQLNENVGSNFTADSVDCGTAPVILGADGLLTCALIQPSSGQVFDVTLSITDLDARAFALEVADTPRPAS